MRNCQERRREMEWDASQSVIPDVIHGLDAQINAIEQRRAEGEEEESRDQLRGQREGDK